MFRIECFVTDKHLPDVLRALGQRVMNLSVQPVVDAAIEKKGKVAKVKANGADVMESFITELRKAPVINAATAQNAARTVGYSPGSYSNLLRRAIDAKLITRKGAGLGIVYSWAQTKPKGDA